MDRYFVFRNQTLELFFPKEYAFSGYDDISYIPDDVSGYVWFYMVPMDPSPSSVISLIDGYRQKYLYLLSKVSSRHFVIALTMERLFFLNYQDDNYGLMRAINAYNDTLYESAKSNPNLKVIDFASFTSQYEANALIDWKYYFISQMGISPRLSKPFRDWWSAQLDSIALRRKKCIVLDLDNTLWGGIVGEYGVEGIKVGGDYPGNTFLFFQKALLELADHGVILCICSKNNLGDIDEVWEKNPYQLLKKSHFSSIRINWIDKPTNILSIANELNIGLDSIVFVDDNPVERELVRQTLPMVTVPHFPEHPYDIPVFIKDCLVKFFKVYAITEEDRKKTDQYKANAAREKASLDFRDYTQFLRSLEMTIKVMPMDDFNKSRIAQMTQKTNQFNMTTRRYSDIDLERMVSRGAKIWCMSVSDRFGDSGITGAIIVLDNEIDSFLMSCRVLGKGIENAFLKYIMSILRECGLPSLKAVYCPTSKNNQVKEFYEGCGFRLIKKGGSGIKYYDIDLAKADLSIDDYYSINIIIRSNDGR